MDDAWTTRAALERVGQSLSHTFENVLEKINFDMLSARALSIRQKQALDLPRTLKCLVDQDRFAFGQCNIVFSIKFSDGIQWVARISCSESDDDVEDEMQREVMVMNLVRKKTRIPLPAIHDYNSSLSRDNCIGYRYILMDFISGDRLDFKNIPNAYHKKLAAQFADYLYQLSTLRSTKLTSIDVDEHNPLDKSDTSPQTSLSQSNSLMFLYEQRARINREAHNPAWKSSEQSLAAARQFLLQAVPLAIEPDYVNGPFPLTHADMHQNNILVDSEFNITGIVDWTHVQTLPMEVFACHPIFVTAVGLSDEQNAPKIKFRTETAKEFRRLAESSQDMMGTRIADLIGSTRAQLANYLLFSPSRMVMVDAKIRVLRLLHGNEATWDDVEKLIVNGPYFQADSSASDG